MSMLCSTNKLLYGNYYRLIIIKVSNELFLILKTLYFILFHILYIYNSYYFKMPKNLFVVYFISIALQFYYLQ